MVQDSLLKEDGVNYELFAWVVMPNHTHSLLRRFEDTNIASILEAHKGATAHEANKVLQRSGQFWREEYFDRYIRNEEHFWNTFRYIENNPVRAGLCRETSDWPFSSARVRKHKNEVSYSSGAGEATAVRQKRGSMGVKRVTKGE